MLSWEQTDKLNEIATNPNMSSEQRTTDITGFMRLWGELVHSRATLPVNHALTHDVIDPAKEATRAKMPIPGQNGRTVYTGLYN